jgi:hypothetical protein
MTEGAVVIMPGTAQGWRRFEPAIAVALVVCLCQLATFSVDVLGDEWPPEAVRWSVGLPMPGVAWAHVEPGTVIPLDEGPHFNWAAPIDIPWLGFDALCTGTSWSHGLHINVPGLAGDGIVACVLYLLLRWILQGDGRYAVRALVVGVGAGAVMESLSRTVLTMQGHSSWLSFAACVLLVPPAISLLARGSSRGWSTCIVMSVIAAWIAAALLRFSDPLLRRKIWSDTWDKSDDLVAVLILSLGWWLLASGWTWGLRRFGTRIEARALGRETWS